MSRKFVRKYYPNTVAISIDEFGMNEEVNIPTMLKRHHSLAITEEMNKILKLGTLSQVRGYVKDNINKHKTK